MLRVLANGKFKVDVSGHTIFLRNVNDEPSLKAGIVNDIFAQKVIACIVIMSYNFHMTTQGNCCRMDVFEQMFARAFVCG